MNDASSKLCWRGVVGFVRLLLAADVWFAPLVIVLSDARSFANFHNRNTKNEIPGQVLPHVSSFAPMNTPTPHLVYICYIMSQLQRVDLALDSAAVTADEQRQSIGLNTAAKVDLRRRSRALAIQPSM